MENHKSSQSYGTNADHNADQKRNTIKFTHLSIKHLKPQKKRKIFWSKGMRGFGIQISPNGSKTWVFQYRINNKGRRMSLAKYPLVSLPEAIKLYSECLDKVQKGIDPLLERKKGKDKDDQELALKELIEIYIEHCKVSGKKSFKNEERAFEKDLPKHLLNKKISKIEPKDIATVISSLMAKGTPGTAQHLFKYTRRMFNFASEIHLLKRRDNPCLEIDIKFPKNKRQRHLNTKEIYLFWNNVENVPMAIITRLALKFLLVTVARPIEVRKMKWSDVDLKNKVWTLPKTKNGRPHRVYLGKLAIDILLEAKKHTYQAKLVFGSTRHFRRCNKENNGTIEVQELRSWSLSQPFRRHFSKFEIEEKFYPYDFRRTGATIIAGLFGRRDLAVLALNHTTSTVTDIYDQYVYDKEKKMSLNALNQAIEFIANSKNVESVPSFEELRESVIESQDSSLDKKIDTQKGFQASFSNPVSYKLSYVHDVSENII